MKRVTPLLFIAVLSIATQKPPSIPKEYQGSWRFDPAYCNIEGDMLDNELYVKANTVGFHAEHYRVKSVKLIKGKVLIRYIELEDATRIPPKELWLSKNKMKLNNAWHRCTDTVQKQRVK